MKTASLSIGSCHIACDIPPSLGQTGQQFLPTMFGCVKELWQDTALIFVLLVLLTVASCAHVPYHANRFGYVSVVVVAFVICVRYMVPRYLHDPCGVVLRILCWF